jgi:hypothetical protein
MSNSRVIAAEAVAMLVGFAVIASATVKPGDLRTSSVALRPAP